MSNDNKQNNKSWYANNGYELKAFDSVRRININKVKLDIQSWFDTVDSPNGNWQGNNLHIDEINQFFNIKRKDWIGVSLLLLHVFDNEFESLNSLILFLHIDLKHSKEKTSLDNMSLNWLKKILMNIALQV